jgi:hypothetical protein
MTHIMTKYVSKNRLTKNWDTYNDKIWLKKQSNNQDT